MYALLWLVVSSLAQEPSFGDDADVVWEKVGTDEKGWEISGEIPAGLDPNVLLDAKGNLYRFRSFTTSGDDEDETGVNAYSRVGYYRSTDADGVQLNRTDLAAQVKAPRSSGGPDLSRLTTTGMYEVHLHRDPLTVPRSAKHLLADDPLVALDAELQRVEAIERRKTQTADAQMDLQAEARQRGLVPGHPLWTSNSFLVELTPDDAVWLEKYPEVDYVVPHEYAVPDGTTGDEIRVGHQIEQFIADGWDGETTFSASSWPDVMIAFVDGSIDSDHVAWLDGSGTASRLKERWCIEPVGSAGFEFVEGSTDCEAANITTIPSSYGETLSTAQHHGTWVASQALADVSEGQVSGQTSAWIKRREGMTDETSFIFIDGFGYFNDVRGSGVPFDAISEGIQLAIERDVDIINMSLGAPNGGIGGPCDEFVRASDLASNAATEVGIVVVASAGNEGTSQTCTVGSPGGAPGVISVGALELSIGSNLPIDPKVASLASYSSRGSDVYGRELVTVLATGGRSNNVLGADGTLADYTGAWSGWNVQGTSFAAPVVSGAIANLIDHGIVAFGAAEAGSMGVMPALTMLMADGMGTNRLNISPSTGAGRLKMRMLNANGLDAPHGHGVERFFVCDGGTTTVPVNSVNGTNTALSTDSETLRVAAWWYEPNASRLQSSSNGVANIEVQLRTTSGSETHTASTGSPGHKVIRVGVVHGTASAGGKTWEIRVTGTDVPTAQDWLPLDCRLLALAWYFEDDDRDDTNGLPAFDIE